MSGLRGCTVGTGKSNTKKENILVTRTCATNEDQPPIPVRQAQHRTKICSDKGQRAVFELTYSRPYWEKLLLNSPCTLVIVWPMLGGDKPLAHCQPVA